jgi:hypothetical protein
MYLPLLCTKVIAITRNTNRTSLKCMLFVNCLIRLSAIELEATGAKCETTVIVSLALFMLLLRRFDRSPTSLGLTTWLSDDAN